MSEVWRTATDRIGQRRKAEKGESAELAKESSHNIRHERLHTNLLLQHLGIAIVTDKRSVNWGNEAVVIIRLGGNVL